MQRLSHPTAYRGVYLPLPHPERPNAADPPLTVPNEKKPNQPQPTDNTR